MEHRSPRLCESVAAGIALVGDPTPPGRVRFGFSTRLGGVSEPPFDSLNLGLAQGDDPRAVAENRRRLLAALGAEAHGGALLCPRQVHGTAVVCLTEPSPEALAEARRSAEAGVDACCVCVPEVPVLLNFADCVPVVLVAPQGFAVVHSGWKGTLAAIAAKALGTLGELSATPVAEIACYVGPHIQEADYEVSAELAARFVARFGRDVSADGRHLSLARCVRHALLEAGASPTMIAISTDSTAAMPERYFSHRRDGEPTGRQGAMAWLAR